MTEIPNPKLTDKVQIFSRDHASERQIRKVLNCFCNTFENQILLPPPPIDLSFLKTKKKKIKSPSRRDSTRRRIPSDGCVTMGKTRGTTLLRRRRRRGGGVGSLKFTVQRAHAHAGFTSFTIIIYYFTRARCRDNGHGAA